MINFGVKAKIKQLTKNLSLTFPISTSINLSFFKREKAILGFKGISISLAKLLPVPAGIMPKENSNNFFVLLISRLLFR